MPAAKPPEFRRRALDLVAQGEPVVRVAKDLGISESCLCRWIEVDAVDTGRKVGLTSDEKKELVELRRRNRSWKRSWRSSNAPRRTSPGRTSSQNSDPAGPRVGRRPHPCRGDLSGAEPATFDVLRGHRS
ncbi:hypothetical protein EAH86_20075 [Pedococcus bigeumensis]|uniref:Transposase n=2 Tax=Pedococcus bigeumensis TaxID=433644 RepID=A0A502CHP0_9MICO|nr:hypothetical protein EAH86_20075 [Pedococcus bigeumensis]